MPENDRAREKSDFSADTRGAVVNLDSLDSNVDPPSAALRPAAVTPATESSPSNE